jgi:hypothetical protein
MMGRVFGPDFDLVAFRIEHEGKGLIVAEIPALLQRSPGGEHALQYPVEGVGAGELQPERDQAVAHAGRERAGKRSRRSEGPFSGGDQPQRSVIARASIRQVAV